MSRDAGNPQALIPLVIGVSGHRDPLEIDKGQLARQVAVLFESLHAQYPHTPLRLLTPLAEGADQIVADAFLLLPVKTRGELIAVLPMPLELYEQDFEGAALVQFRAALARADRVIEIPLAAGADRSSIEPAGAARDAQYQRCGQFVSRHSQLLVALWDGRPAHGRGGTGDIVQYRQRGCFDERQDSILDLEERGPSWHLVTPRASHAERQQACVPPTPYAEHWLFPPMVRGDLEPEGYFRGLWREIDTFNADAHGLATQHVDAIPHSEQSLIPDSAIAALPDSCRQMRLRYAVADALAIRLQRRWRRLQRLLHLFAVLTLLAFEFGQFDGDALGGHYKPWAYSTACVFMILAFLTYRRGSGLRLQDRYQDYRALAEGLRVQFFWTLAGVRQTAADRYLGRQRNALDWIRKALRTATLPLTNFRSEGLYPHAEAYWVRSQNDYYRQSEDARRERRAALWSRTLLSVGLIGLVGLVISTWMGASSFARACWMSAFVLPTGFAGIIDHYAGKMAFSEHAELYARMSRMFDYALELLTESLQRKDSLAVERVVEDLGIAALEENASWLMLHRERPLEMPHQ